MFRSEIGSGFEDSGGTPPPRIPRSTPSPPGSAHQLSDHRILTAGFLGKLKQLSLKLFIKKASFKFVVSISAVVSLVLGGYRVLCYTYLENLRKSFSP